MGGRSRRKAPNSSFSLREAPDRGGNAIPCMTILIRLLPVLSVANYLYELELVLFLFENQPYRRAGKAEFCTERVSEISLVMFGNKLGMVGKEDKGRWRRFCLAHIEYFHQLALLKGDA